MNFNNFQTVTPVINKSITRKDKGKKPDNDNN
jgi:hypothetical protein